MRVRRAVAMATAGALGLSMLVPSAAQASSMSPDTESGTLTIQTYSSLLPGLTDVVKQYQAKNPGVKVTYLVLSTSTSRGANILQLSSSAAPDIGFVELSTGVYSALVQQDDLESLQSVWTADNLAKEYPAGSIAYMNSSKSTVPYGALLFAGWGSMIYYNENLFKKAGVSAPAGHEFKDMAQFGTLAKQLQVKGTTPLSVACNSPEELGHLVDDLLPTATTPAQWEAYLSNWKRGSASPVKYTSPPFVNVLQTIENWTSSNIIEPGCLSQTDASSEALFANGETAMYEGNTYNVPQLQGTGKPTFPIGWFMVPPVRSGVATPFWTYSGSMFVVPTHADNKTLAYDFLKFLGTRQELSLYAAGNAQLPIIKDAVSETEPYSFLPEVISLERKVGTALIWDSAVPDTLGQKFDGPALQNMVAGKSTVEQTAEQFQQALVALQSGKVVPPGQ